MCRHRRRGASVRAEGDERELDDLEITTGETRLRIGQRRNSSWGFGHDRGAVTVYVTVPALAHASIGGSGDMRVDRVQGRSFEANIGGSGDIEIAALRVEQARFAIAGSGDIRASGQAETPTSRSPDRATSTWAMSRAAPPRCRSLGSGDVRIRASETANVSMMGSGDVVVLGPARCTVWKMGSGEVSCSA